MTLFDKRQAFFKEHFEKGANFSSYVDGLTSERWQQAVKNVKLSPQQRELLEGFVRKINVLILSDLACGDCARQCPVLRAFEEVNPDRICLRFLDNSKNTELQDELRIHGGARVPVVVFLSEDFFEVSRFGDRTLSAYRKKAGLEKGAACGLPGASSEEIAEWLNELERVELLLRVSPFLRQRHRD
jgi:hypothetical protein